MTQEEEKEYRQLEKDLGAAEVEIEELTELLKEAKNNFDEIVSMAVSALKNF